MTSRFLRGRVVGNERTARCLAEPLLGELAPHVEQRLALCILVRHPAVVFAGLRAFVVQRADFIQTHAKEPSEFGERTVGHDSNLPANTITREPLDG